MSKYKQRRKKKKVCLFKKKIFLFSLLGVLVLVSLFYLLFPSPFFKVERIGLIAETEVNIKEIHSILDQRLENTLFSNYFLFNTRKAKRDILSSFLRVQEIEVTRVFPSQITFELKKRIPIVLLCQEKCFLMSEDRIVFQEKDKEMDLPIIEIEQDIKVGDAMLLEKETQRILEAYSFLDNIGVAKAVKNNNDLVIEMEEGWQVHFNLEDDIVLSLTKLKLLLEKEISETKDLEYIDLRYKKVYYK